MKLDVVKKKLIKELAIAFSIVFAVGIIFYYASSHESSMEDEIKSIKREISSISNKVKKSNLEKDSFIISLDSYTNIPESRLPTKEGYGNTASRIRVVRPIIESLKEKYKFSLLDVTFSNIEEKSKEYNVTTLSVINNDLLVRFEGMSDELVFSFVSELMGLLPGYVQLKELSVERSDSGMYSESLTLIENSGELRPFVTGNIIFTWNTLRGEQVAVEKDDKNS